MYASFYDLTKFKKQHKLTNYKVIKIITIKLDAENKAKTPKPHPKTNCNNLS